MKTGTKTTATKEEARPALVPKLRFPEFRDCAAWEPTTIGALGNFYYGKSAPKWSLSDDAPTPCVRYGELYTKFGPIITETYSRTNTDPETLRFSKGGEILIPRVGEKPEDFGKCCCYLPLKGIAIGEMISVLETKQHPLFYTHYFRHLHKQFAKVVEGQNVKNLYYVELEPLPIHRPSVAEQQKIAECLSSVDELMAAQARKVDALKTHKKGLMQQLFPREGETQPRLRFPEFQNAGEWEEAPLSQFILSLDAGVSVNSGDRSATKTEFGVLKTSAVTNGVFESEENKVVLSEGEQSRLKEPVSSGTIIISRMNTPALVGANAYVESSHENLFLPDRLWSAKPREGVSMRFLAFILGSDKGRAALSKLAKGSSGSMKNITKPEVLAFSVMAPSPAEQQRIATCLSSLDALITAETQKHEALKTHKKGLMQQLFPSPEEVTDS